MVPDDPATGIENFFSPAVTRETVKESGADALFYQENADKEERL